MDFAPHKILILPILIFAFLIGCAEIGPPPGGPIDKTKPRIAESIPADGSTLVPSDNKIIITFSERVSKPLPTSKPIYISPRPISEPELKWKSDKLTIILADSFEVNQTYIVSFGDGIKDFQNNPLDSGSIIAFTTGEVLASGVIGGQVIDNNNNPIKNKTTALYKKSDFDTTSVIDSLYPNYLTTSDDQGYFTFRYIPNGEYLLIAMDDMNKNERLDTERELFGIPQKLVVLDSTTRLIENIQLPLTFHHTNDTEIKSVRQTKDNIFQIDFNTLNNYILPDSIFTLQSYTDSSQNFQSQFILKNDKSTENSLQINS